MLLVQRVAKHKGVRTCSCHLFLFSEEETPSPCRFVRELVISSPPEATRASWKRKLNINTTGVRCTLSTDLQRSSVTNNSPELGTPVLIPPWAPGCKTSNSDRSGTWSCNQRTREYDRRSISFWCLTSAFRQCRRRVQCACACSRTSGGCGDHLHTAGCGTVKPPEKLP